MTDSNVGLRPTVKRGLGRLGAPDSAARLPGMEANTTLWLARPEAPQDPDSVAAMRRAIEEDGAREGSLAGECLDAARARGLSGEQAYIFLAYQALLRLEETHQRHIYLSDLAPPVAPVAPVAAKFDVRARARRLVRGVVDLALRTERAAAQFTRTSVGRG